MICLHTLASWFWFCLVAVWWCRMTGTEQDMVRRRKVAWLVVRCCYINRPGFENCFSILFSCHSESIEAPPISWALRGTSKTTLGISVGMFRTWAVDNPCIPPEVNHGSHVWIHADADPRSDLIEPAICAGRTQLATSTNRRPLRARFEMGDQGRVLLRAMISGETWWNITWITNEAPMDTSRTQPTSLGIDYR